MSEPTVIYHSWLEDAQALIVAPLFIAFAVMLFQKAGLFMGGTVGIAFLIHYWNHWPISGLLFLINLPFYILGVRALGWAFTLKTFAAVSLLSAYTYLLPKWITVQSIDPLFATIMAGFLVGVGLLILIRHKASLGGIGILVIYLQNTRGWRAGKLQMGADIIILGCAALMRDPVAVGLSIIGAIALNLVIAVNHRAGRYMGT